MNIVNPELQLAEDFVQQTNCHVFLTGRAGTGKTTFLHELKKKTAKRLIVTAPTGVAAINAGGVTLHSFFQLPFGPIVPGSSMTGSDPRQYRFSKEKQNIIKSLDLLIIDEVSMVRPDLLDGVDAVLRRFRRSSKPFGGVQLLMIGDLHQLPPVVNDEEWSLLQNSYQTIYFFSSLALAKTELVSIELQHVYRQSDQHFIDLLNKVRDNNLDAAAMEELNSRYVRDFIPKGDEGYITLCSHNRNADVINQKHLATLPDKSHRFKADVQGDFSEHTYPTAAVLELKKGAQVMFVRNDHSGEKRYFNGKIGLITHIGTDKIRVQCPEDEQAIEVEQAVWEKITYKLDQESMEIQKNKTGEFTQYPLRLAWAITIHKSQGLTFEKAIIDAGQAFAHGQVYVALSRCKTFDGMVLSSQIGASSVKTDSTVSSFVLGISENQLSPQKLEDSRIAYQRQLLLECFDFGRLRYHLGRFVGILRGSARNITVSGVDDLNKVEQQARQDICEVSTKFGNQLQGLFASTGLPETDTVIQERVCKASSYFVEKFDLILADFVKNVQTETDNKELRKRVKKAFDALSREAAMRRAAVVSCAKEFTPAAYLLAISTADVQAVPSKQKKTQTVTYTEADVGHPELFQTLREWRTEEAREENVPPFRILHQSVLIQVAITLPDKHKDLLKVKGIGKRLAERYGDDLVAMVSSYRQKHGIEQVVLPEPTVEPEADKVESKPGKKVVADTKQTSLQMFVKGMTLEEIARERGLVVSTIEGHMAHFVGNGEIEVGQLVAEEKSRIIAETIDSLEEATFGQVKEALGDEYSYGEIKIVAAGKRFAEQNI